LATLAFWRSPAFQKNVGLVMKECGPPAIGDVVPSLKSGMANLQKEAAALGGNTMQQIGVKALVVAEVLCWFQVGKVIGRGNLRGFGHMEELH
jgi:hypothetical protein